jgi:ATP-dependent helicase HrpA
MISRRQGGGDEAYFTYAEEADDAANKDSALMEKLVLIARQHLCNHAFCSPNDFFVVFCVSLKEQLLPDINQKIKILKQNLNKAMAVDDYQISREIESISHRPVKDNTSFISKRLFHLQKKLQYSQQRYFRRAGSIPALNFPKELPISKKKEEIIAAIRKEQVVIITGETGSGKTTQIPKMCLAAGLGLRGIIGLTQPRRIAATSIAQRIATEIGESCGKSIAYKIRFAEKTSAEPLIKVMTDGILLAETLSDPLLLSYDTIIVDEAHERSLNIDFILGFLRTLLERRKDLKLIITSATIDTAKFATAFYDAPVIEVSGRMYPVEVRYEPIDPVKEENGELTYVDTAIACVEKLQKERRFEDILIFMPTEQDIREVCKRLAKRCSGLILPLYARLSGSQQRIIFEDAVEQKIIVATNIAETSLTIPGIKYVIDSGLARQLEYNPRSQTTGLPIKPISRSSAEQRKGRCGRVQNGVCIRLYSADAYQERPLYTAPEILRSNLAGVILRMISLNLGAVNTFPFIDSPHPKSIRDGIDILYDLGAIEKSNTADETVSYKLTPIGFSMSQFPLDPRIARILIEAQKAGCTKEVAIIAAALSIQDPRERPYDKTDQAAAAHARFANFESDFITYFNIWNHFHDTLEKLHTQNKMRKFCHEHFLSYKRMIEWRDICNQILGIISGDKKITKHKKHTKMEIDQNIYDKIHKCILSGYLSHIAQKQEKNFYLAAKSREVMLFPGSGLFNRGGSWIVAAEIAQTSRLFARTAANIKSEWLEELGKDNCRYTYAAAHWEKNRGQVVAREKVTLFGLTIVEARNVTYDKINPQEAKDIFIREALVRGEVSRRPPFLEHNLALWEEIKTMEDKLRRRGLAVDEETIARLYEERLPIISDIRSLLKLIKDKGSDEFLRFSENDFQAGQPDLSEVSLYPDKINIGDATLSLGYRFNPGKSDDGVSMKIPLGLVSTAAEQNIERFVPKLMQDKVSYLVKSLPRTLRHKLPQATSFSSIFIAENKQWKKPLPQALSQFIQDKYQVAIPTDAWDMTKLPEHLNIRFNAIDDKGQEINSSRDINILKNDISGKVKLAVTDEIRLRWERENITRWDFGELPESIPLTGKQGVTGYVFPTLQAVDDMINLRLFPDRKESEAVHLHGIAALYLLHFAEKIKQLKKNIAITHERKILSANIGNSKVLEQSIMKRITNDLFRKPWRRQEDFLSHAATVNTRILAYGQQVLDFINPVLNSVADTCIILERLRKKNIRDNPVREFLDESTLELQHLVPVNFPELYSFDRMKELPRYLKALTMRAERGNLNLSSAERKIRDISFYSKQLDEFQKNIAPDTSAEKKIKIEELFWMIEEYKVSLFAQELKTPYPVSKKKLDLLIKEIKETL